MTERSRRSDGRRSAVRRLLVAFACVLLLAGPAVAQISEPTLTVAPNRELTHGQYVDVAWSGFESRSVVRIRLCPGSATQVNDCAQSSPSQREPGDTRVGLSGAGGSGSIPFIIRAGDVVPLSGADPFLCDAANACQLVATSGTQEDFSGAVRVELEYAASTVACPLGGDRIAGSGGSSVRGAMVQWQSEVCGDPHQLNVSYIITNSIQGTDAFVEGLPDSEFAVSGMPLGDDQLASLTERSITPRYAPITAGSLVFVYNLWYDRDGDGRKEQVKDLQLSPATLAAIMQGRITSWNAPAILADNPTHNFPVKQVKVVARADNSAATYWTTSWFWEAARETWIAGGDDFDDGPTTIFPAGNGIILRTGTDAVAFHVRSFPGEIPDENADIPRQGFIGFVYNSEAQKLGLPVVALRNGAGNYVKPTDESLAAAFAAGSLSAEGVFTPNLATTDPAAYPLPIASYLIAASGDDPGTDPLIADALSRFIEYSISTGQEESMARGYVTLPATLKTAAQASAAAISSQPQPSPAPTAEATPAPVAAADATPAVQSQGSPSEQVGVVGASAAPSAPIGAPGRGSAQPAPAGTPAAGDLTEKASRAIAGIIGLGGIGSVPIGMPALVGFAICALAAGRLLLNRSERRSTANGAHRARRPGSIRSRLARSASPGR